MHLGPLVFDLSGIRLTQEEKDIILHPFVGGIILFARNYDSPSQLFQLVQEIRSIRANVLILVDQEGGRVQRFKEEFTRLPALRLLGSLYDAFPDKFNDCLGFAQNLGTIMALEVNSFGIDLSLAPVVDLDRGISTIIGDRAFHHNPDIVIELAQSYIKGMREVGMPATLKHFPGHGSVAPDSHHELPIDDRNEQEIAEDLKVFKLLIKDNNAEAIMPAHILYNKIDKLPPCFSRIWLQDILRDALNFKGVIMSDDLSMEATYDYGNYSEKVAKALESGCDLVLVCNNRAGVRQILKDNISYNTENSDRLKKLSNPTPFSSWMDLRSQKVWKKNYEGIKKFISFCASLNPTLV